MSSSSNSPDEVLRLIFAAYAANRVDKAVRDYLTDTFNDFELRQIETTNLAFNQSVIVDDTARAIVIHSDNKIFPHLAVLRKGDDLRWKLDIFISQCPACFSTGIVTDDTCCPSCGGTGWGTLGELDFHTGSV